MPAGEAGAGRCRRCGAELIRGGRFCPQCAAPVEAQGGKGADPFAATQVAPARGAGAVHASSGASGRAPAGRGDPRRVAVPPTVLEVAAPDVRRAGAGARPAAVPPTMIEAAGPARGSGGPTPAVESRGAPAERIGWGAVLAAAAILLFGVAAAVAAQFIPWERWM